MEREIKRLKRSRIPLVKVCWNSRRGPEFTWEREDSFKQKYPQLFTNRASSSTTRSIRHEVPRYIEGHSLESHNALGYSIFRCYPDLGVLQIGIITTWSLLSSRFKRWLAYFQGKLIVNMFNHLHVPLNGEVFHKFLIYRYGGVGPGAAARDGAAGDGGGRAPSARPVGRAVMSSASYAVNYTSVYTDSEPWRPVAPPSPDYIPDSEEPHTPPVPQDEDERKPKFIQPHDPDYVPEPIYHEYIPLEDEHEFPVEEQPLPPVIIPPTTESPGYLLSRIQKKDPEGASISLPPEAEVERLLAMPTPPPSPPISLSPPSARERLTRCMAPPAHLSPPPVPSPLLPSSGCPTQIQTLRIASTQALVDAVTAALPSPPLPPLPPSLYIPPPVDHRDDIPEFERPPRKRSCLFALGSRYEVGESSTARPTGEAVPKIAPMTVGEAHAIGLGQAVHYELQTHREQAEMAELQETDRRRQAQMVETLRVMRDMRREIGDMQTELLALREPQSRARQPGPDVRVPDHQDASRDADSHI
ncbi:hypothetical protein Tco_1221552 [Tanacetum coccineum]